MMLQRLSVVGFLGLKRKHLEYFDTTKDAEKSIRTKLDMYDYITVEDVDGGDEEISRFYNEDYLKGK